MLTSLFVCLLLLWSVCTFKIRLQAAAEVQTQISCVSWLHVCWSSVCLPVVTLREQLSRCSLSREEMGVGRSAVSAADDCCSPGGCDVCYVLLYGAHTGCGVCYVLLHRAHRGCGVCFVLLHRAHRRCGVCFVLLHGAHRRCRVCFVLLHSAHIGCSVCFVLLHRAHRRCGVCYVFLHRAHKGCDVCLVLLLHRVHRGCRVWLTVSSTDTQVMWLCGLFWFFAGTHGVVLYGLVCLSYVRLGDVPCGQVWIFTGAHGGCTVWSSLLLLLQRHTTQQQPFDEMRFCRQK